MRVLLVDDSEIDRDLASLILRPRGHEVREAASAREALELLRSTPFDVVVTDLVMPEIDGYEFAYKLRSDSGLPSLPIVFFSAAYTEGELRDLDLAYENCKFVAKPVEPQRLLDAVREAVELGPPAAAPPPELDEFRASRLRVLSAKLAQTLEEATRTADELKMRLRQQEAVATLGHSALVGQDVSALQNDAVAQIAETLGTELVAVFGATHGMDALLLQAGVGWADGLVGAATVPAGADSAAGHALALPEPVIVVDLATDPRFSCPLLLNHGAVSGASVVILGRGEPYGVLCAYARTRREFTDGDALFLQSVANVLAVAVQREEDERERKRAEAERQAREEQFRAVFERSLDPIVITSSAGRIIDANPAACELFGLPIAEVVDRSWADFVPNELLSESQEGWQRLLETGSATGFSRVRSETGEERDVECRASASTLPGQHVVVVRDLTERNRLEAQLRQAQKMEAVGRLAGGIAHDFNNILTIITGYSDLALNQRPADAKVRGSIEEIQAAAECAAELTRQLLAFGRRQVVEPRVLDVNAVVRGMEQMLRRVIGEDVEFRLNLDEDAGHVLADHGQLEQVLMNLVVNARDAMPAGGILTVATGHAEFDEASARRHGVDAAPGTYVMLGVSDTGVGMDVETQSHIFEPFFTTKEVGKGTGLGLSTVYGIVKQGGGLVCAYSEPGYGAMFKIYLPVVVAEADALPARHAPAQPARGSETVLLVEDDASVRQLVREMLESQGYAVLEATDPADAIDLCSSATPIDLLVSDVVMPGMSGIELCRRVASVRPDIRTLCMSGYTEHVMSGGELGTAGAAFIGKPFSSAALTSKIREVLDAVRGRARLEESGRRAVSPSDILAPARRDPAEISS